MEREGQGISGGWIVGTEMNQPEGKRAWGVNDWELTCNMLLVRWIDGSIIPIDGLA